jgi:hypothetical protein
MTEREKELLESHKRMGDLLVQLHYASRVVVDETTMLGTIVWTPEGTVFKDLLANAYDQIAKGKGKDGMTEFVTLMTWIIKHR